MALTIGALLKLRDQQPTRLRVEAKPGDGLTGCKDQLFRATFRVWKDKK